MKLWHLVFVLVLLGGGFYIVTSELKYNRLLDKADAQADTVEMMRGKVDSLTQEAVEQAGLVSQLRTRMEMDSLRSVRERASLRAEMAEARRQAETIERDLRARLDSTNAALLDDLVAEYAVQIEARDEEIHGLEERIRLGQQLIRETERALRTSSLALESCRCALDKAEAALDTYGAATAGSRGFLSRAWDTITSRRGLFIAGGILVGLLVYDHVTDDSGRDQAYAQGVSMYQGSLMR